MRTRRLRKHAADIEVTAFINLIVVLVPFLLSTAVFTRMAVVDVSLPAPSNAAIEHMKVNDLKLEVVIRPDRLDLGDRVGGLIQRFDRVDGRYDTQALGALVQGIKAKFPDITTATVLAQPDTPYDVLVDVMDALREAQAMQGTKLVRTALFPDISIGDAPIAQR